MATLLLRVCIGQLAVFWLTHFGSMLEIRHPYAGLKCYVSVPHGHAP